MKLMSIRGDIINIRIIDVYQWSISNGGSMTTFRRNGIANTTGWYIHHELNIGYRYELLFDSAKEFEDLEKLLLLM